MKLFHVLLTYLASYVALIFADVDAIPYELLSYYYIHKLEMDAGYSFDERKVFFRLEPLEGEPYLRWGVVVQFFTRRNWLIQLTPDDRTTFNPDEAAGERITENMPNNIRNDPKQNKIPTSGLNYDWEQFKLDHPNDKVGGGRLATEMHQAMSDAIARSGANTKLSTLSSIVAFSQAAKTERASKIGPAFIDYLKNLFPTISQQITKDAFGMLDSDATFAAIEEAHDEDTADSARRSIADATKEFLKLESYTVNGETVGGFREHEAIIRKLGATIDTAFEAIRNLNAASNPTLPAEACAPM